MHQDIYDHDWAWYELWDHESGNHIHSTYSKADMVAMIHSCLEAGIPLYELSLGIEPVGIVYVSDEIQAFLEDNES